MKKQSKMLYHIKLYYISQLAEETELELVQCVDLFYLFVLVFVLSHTRRENSHWKIIDDDVYGTDTYE